MKLSDKLIMLRKESGWSQEDFAEKVEVSRQAISRWENGTALPDAQNILRISKLFHVTADYLLNDDYDREEDTPSGEVAEPAPNAPLTSKKMRRWFWIPVICILLLAAVAAVFAVSNLKDTDKEVHSHPFLIRVIENKVAPTCTEQGSYDEVIYCRECGKELLRTHITYGMPSHQFENEKCIICGEDQRERGQ